jgi:molybdopterin molybdotransferase
VSREFFQVVSLEAALGHRDRFAPVGAETVDLDAAVGRVLAADVTSDRDLPGFRRSTVDGYAVAAASTFGASESQPALLAVVGAIEMGGAASLAVGPGQAARIPTGGMLPAGADAVVMVEHTEPIDDTALEVVRSVAPHENVIQPADDAAAGETLVRAGRRLRAQEIGLLAALGRPRVAVRRRPRVAVVSTGDEVVPIDAEPAPGQIRDVNSYSLAAQVEAAGGLPARLGIVADDPTALARSVRDALAGADMVLVSGGSSVGARDHTLDVLTGLPAAELLVHGVAIRPGKPTLLVAADGKSVWGLPGHVASAMVVFQLLVRPYLDQLAGLTAPSSPFARVRARLARNLPSVHGRLDVVRVRLEARDGALWAVPVLGKSGVLRTLVEADGVIEIPRDTEGLEAGVEVEVRPI